MAARPDQNLKIGLIISAMMIFILCITTYLFYRWNTEAEARAADLQTQKNTADNAARQTNIQNEALLTMLGFDPATDFADLEEQFKKDQERFMSNFGPENQNYRETVDSFFEENQRIAQQEALALEREKELKVRLLALEAEKEAQIADVTQKLSKTQQELAAERTKFNLDRSELETQRAALVQSRQRNLQEYQSQIAAAQSNEAEAKKQLVDSERAKSKLLSERQLSNPSFEVADGRITYVNQANQTVWINLGETDSIRRQVVFSVFNSDLTDAGKAEKKGSIEVTRLLGDHLAEARITSDEISNPILPGDQIYSQVWRSGKKLRFALTGLMDLDGDGKSDLQQAKDMITLNGGEVDASLEEDGQVEGEMSVNTRYLVLGDYPNQPSKAKIRGGYDNMSRDASSLGVETITLVDFMNQMGYKQKEKTTNFSGGNPSRGGAPAAGGRSFRFRTP